MEAVHVPLHARAFLRGTLHPISALCISIFWTSGWAVLAPMTLFADMAFFSEVSYQNEGHVWDTLAILRCCIAASMGGFWLVYLGFAARAVHLLRLEKERRGSAKRGSERLEGERAGELELELELGKMSARDGKETKEGDERVDSVDLGSVDLRRNV